MKSTIYYDFEIPDDERCQQLYDRQLFVSSPRKSILDFVGFARSIICAFGDLVPRTAQDRIELERYADLLGKLKPGFIHHLESKRHFADDARGLGIIPGISCIAERMSRSSPRTHGLSTRYLTYRD